MVKKYTHLSFWKEVGEVFHRIAAKASDVLVAARFWGPQWLDTIPHIIRHFHSDLQAQHEFVWEQWRQLHLEKTKEKDRYEWKQRELSCRTVWAVNGELPRSPPYPHPMSANSTLQGFFSEESSAKKCGYSSDQSISSGQTGLKAEGDIFQFRVHSV